MTTILATFFYEVFKAILIFFWQGNTFLFVKEFWFFCANSIITNVVVVFLLFYLFNFLFNRFNSIFIKSSRTSH